jgi:hypothetical protein
MKANAGATWACLTISSVANPVLVVDGGFLASGVNQ